MSIFTLKDWWSVKIAEDEEFDIGCLAVGNIDNGNPSSNKIVVASHNGMIRIYAPSGPQFRIEDLLFEEKVSLNDEPILQILLGRFLPNSDNLALAILFPRKLGVYELLSKSSGTSSKHTIYKLSKNYEHPLGIGIDAQHFSAYNMVSGQFGNNGDNETNKEGEMIMVQSLDGKLQVFDQSAHAFTLQLVDSLIPGPLLYVPTIDAFITGSYANRTECYKYQVLAATQSDVLSSSSLSLSSSSDTINNNNNIAKGINSNINNTIHNNSKTLIGLTAVRSALMEWSHCTGETIIQLVSGRFTNIRSKKKKQEIIALCDRSLFLIKEGGGIIQQKKLDREYSPICAHAFMPGDGSDNGLVHSNSDSKSTLMVAFADGVIQIYSDFAVVWAARSPYVPIDMKVASFNNQKGLIVTLSDIGQLSISYLGTTIPRKVVTSIQNSTMSLQNRGMSYSDMEREYTNLQRLIRETQSNGHVFTKDKILMRTQVTHRVTSSSEQSNSNSMMFGSDIARSAFGDTNDKDIPVPLSALINNPHGDPHHNGNDKYGHVKVTVRLYISYTGTDSLNNVNIIVSTPHGVKVEPPSIVLNSLSGNNNSGNSNSKTDNNSKGFNSRSTPLLLTFTFTALQSIPHSELKATFISTYITSRGEPCSVSHDTVLPLILAARIKPPTKQAKHKIVLSMGGAYASKTINLPDIFDDFLLSNQESGLNCNEILGKTANTAMGLLLWGPEGDSPQTYETGEILNNNGSDDAMNIINHYKNIMNSGAAAGVGYATASILVSKQGGKYRVQADSPWALAFVTIELEKRLRNLLTTQTPPPSSSSNINNNINNNKNFNTDNLVLYNEDLPLDDFFAAIDRHFAIRIAVKEINSTLNDRSHQFRQVQKRLLVRYKEKNPVPLSGLDLLLKETYNDIMSLSDRLELLLDMQTNALSHIIIRASLLSMLVVLKNDHLNENDRKILQEHLCPIVNEGILEDGQGWEETVEASLSYLLKTSLAKTPKETAVLPEGLDMPISCDKLRKQIEIVIERLCRGSKLSSNSNQGNGREIDVEEGMGEIL